MSQTETQASPGSNAVCHLMLNARIGSKKQDAYSRVSHSKKMLVVKVQLCLLSLTFTLFFFLSR